MLLVWREDTNSNAWTEAEATNYLDLCEQGLNIANCKPIPVSVSRLVVEIKTRREPADFFFAGLIFVVSAPLRTILEQFNANIQFVAVKTLHLGEHYTRRKFYFANILELVECFDYEKSKYKQTPSGIHEITKLVLDESKAVGHHLFKVGPLPSSKRNPKSVCDVIRCVDESLAARIVESGLSGVVFSKLKDWRKYPPPSWT